MALFAAGVESEEFDLSFFVVLRQMVYANEFSAAVFDLFVAVELFPREFALEVAGLDRFEVARGIEPIHIPLERLRAKHFFSFGGAL